jgi:hypothetical protein
MVTAGHAVTLTTGRTVGDAFYEMYYLEQACRLQVAATQGGQKVVVPPDSVAEHAARQFESFESRGQRPWAALKRFLLWPCRRRLSSPGGSQPLTPGSGAWLFPDRHRGSTTIDEWLRVHPEFAER